MWCPKCNKEYHKGNTQCPVCGATLERSLSTADAQVTWSFSSKNEFVKNWPLNDAGEPEIAALLTYSLSTNMEDSLIINKLAAYGIPAMKRYPQNGTLGKVILGMSGTGVSIYVPAFLLEDARALMEDVEND